jgi:hypothetical protein
MEKDEHQAVARELAIRKRLGKVFKKKREDFATEEEYNNYLEAFEDAVYSLSEGTNTDEAQASMERLAKYIKDTSREEILMNPVLIVDDESEDKNNESSEQQGVTFVDPTRPAKPMPAPLRDNSPVDEKMRARASIQGFDEKLCRQRALEELVSSLFFPPFVA